MAKRRRRVWTIAIAGTLASTAGCYRGLGGDAGADGAGDDAGSSGDDAAQREPTAGGGSDTGAPDACDGEIQVAHAPLRRLTREQYANAVRDLLGVEADTATLAGDEKVGPFDANYAAPVSATNVDQFRALAEDVAAAAVLDLGAVLPCDPATSSSCIDEWIDSFGRRAYRRPLTATEHGRYVELAALGEDPAVAVELVIRAMLQSPAFLYHLELGAAEPGEVIALEPYELAARLSFFLWNSTPDDALLDAAAAGELSEPGALRDQAERLLADPRARTAVESFHVQWLAIDKLALAEKDTEVYPAFDDELRAAMIAETRRFAGAVIFDGDARLETLLTSNVAYVDEPLLAYYGVAADPGHDPNAPVELDPKQRAGLLTQGAFLAAHAHADQSGPIQRGVTVLTNVLCTPPPPPPPNINVIPPDPDPNATTREIFEMHTADPTCAGCHKLIDGIGLGFEGYDGIGGYREVENGLPVDQSGEVVGSDVEGPFDGAVELAHKLAGSSDVRDCVATQWFRFSVRRFEDDADSCTLDRLKASFAESDSDVRELLIALVQTDAFRYRAP
jgi:Protein of unknown function (DUF1592)/Protein of unknown function (DUF1588)/Protein of unknown function (DUF1595)/Protein of unknown function (DUF1585)/Protein of unknown function (DUF1587)